MQSGVARSRVFIHYLDHPVDAISSIIPDKLYILLGEILEANMHTYRPVQCIFLQCKRYVYEMGGLGKSNNLRIVVRRNPHWFLLVVARQTQ